MRSTTLFFLGTLSCSSAKLGKGNDSKDGKFERLGDREHYLEKMKPTNVGDFHTDAFHKLGEVYSEKGPSSDFELMQNIGEVMASFCPSQDTLCDAFVYKATIEEFFVASNGGPQIEYPKGFNEDLKEALDITENMINTLNADNVYEVVDELEVIIDDIESMKSINSDEQNLAIASVSVAKESTKLWHDAMTDSDHKLHNLVMDKAKHFRRRRLDESPELITIEFEGIYWDGLFGSGGLLQGVVKADYRGTLNGGLGLIETVPENPLLLWPWNWPILAFYVAAFHSIPASAQFIFGRNSTALLR